VCRRERKFARPASVFRALSLCSEVIARKCYASRVPAACFVHALICATADVT
jgi:hypothetical protein